MRRRWTAEEDDTLRKDFGKKRNREIAAALYMSVSAVGIRARELGLAAEPARSRTVAEDELVRKLYRVETALEIAERLGRSRHAIDESGAPGIEEGEG